MKIVLLEPFGYCVGVARAIKMANEAKMNNPSREIVVLGMLVHNNDALKSLETTGIRTINCPNNDLMASIKLIPQNALVILTAHGHPQEVEQKLKELGIEYIDATCPFVKLSHSDIATSIANGKSVFYIGKKNHPEAIGALSISEKVHLIDFSQPVIPDLSDNEPVIVSQTTFSSSEISSIVNLINKKYPKAKIIRSLCSASDERQKSLLSMGNDVQLIYVVGGKNSNNTQTLIRLASAKYPNAKVKAIENKHDIDKKDLKGLSYIAISSGASTPSEISMDVYDYLNLLCN